MANEVIEKKEQISQTYDDMFQKGGDGGVFDLPYCHSPYYPLFKRVLKTIRKYAVEDILEVGCGTGAFAHLVQEKANIGYRGFDFSPIAVEKAGRRLNSSEHFYRADATRQESYRTDYDAIVCTEVLEHVEQDLEVIGHWRVDALCICSVPNFDSPYHVRYFTDAGDVANRYGHLFDIKSIVTIKKPVLSDLTLSSYIQYLRWNRYRPQRIMELFGLGDFGKVGGWFLLTGRRL